MGRQVQGTSGLRRLGRAVAVAALLSMTGGSSSAIELHELRVDPVARLIKGGTQVAVRGTFGCVEGE